MSGGGAAEVAKDYAAGVAAGVATVLTGHPFDTVKVKLQAQAGAGGAGPGAGGGLYQGAWHCTSHTLSTQGIRGLYKGATSSFIGVAIESSVLFGAYSQIKTALQGGERSSPSLPTIVAAAGVSGGGVSLILCPTELVKCRLQVQQQARAGQPSPGGRLPYAGPWDCAVRTVQADGVAGLFRGLRATFFREAIGNCFFFCVYETTRFQLLHAIGLDPDRKRVGSPEKAHAGGNQVELSETFREGLLEAGTGVVSGGLAGIAFWSAVLPFDVVKTRVQTDRSGTTGSVTYHLKSLYRQAGVRGLYAGLGPTLMRAFPANAAAIVTWELAARLLGVGPGLS
eukprot:jgi/Mesen1/3243/ME000187S02400